jgi:hypothetical protein
MQNKEEKPESKRVNWEKLSVYIACLGFIYMFWASQDTLKETNAIIRERLARVEERLEIRS